MGVDIRSAAPEIGLGILAFPGHQADPPVLLTRLPMSISPLVDLVNAGGPLVVFSGAGISTESGIPDFRSPGGVWSRFRQVLFHEFVSDPEDRKEYWRQKCLQHHQWEESEPNRAHRIVASWEQQGLVRGVITQNIDGLHQAAGTRNLLELHGNARQVGCLRCDFREKAGRWVAEFERTQEPPICPRCSGLLKHATISFGQSLSPEVLMAARQWSRQARLFLVLGSSLVVTPAADLPRVAKEHGSRLAIVNRDETPLDRLADVVIHDGVGEVLEEVDRSLSGSCGDSGTLAP